MRTILSIAVNVFAHGFRLAVLLGLGLLAGLMVAGAVVLVVAVVNYGEHWMAAVLGIVVGASGLWIGGVVISGCRRWLPMKPPRLEDLTERKQPATPRELFKNRLALVVLMSCYGVGLVAMAAHQWSVVVGDINRLIVVIIAFCALLCFYGAYVACRAMMAYAPLVEEPDDYRDINVMDREP